MKQRSLLLITVDCLRADHAGFLGYRRGTTPFLDSLATESFTFPRAIVAGAPTYFSFPGIMVSRHPLSLGRDIVGVAPGEETLATSLQRSGYATAAFLAANPYLSPRFGYQQGFATFQDFLSTELPSDKHRPPPARFTRLNNLLQRASRKYGVTAAVYDELYFRYCQWHSFRGSPSMEQLRRYPAADVVIDQARCWLSSRRQQPFFLWLHLMDPHHPYYPREDALTEFGCDEISARRAGFLNAFWTRSNIKPQRLRKYRGEILSLYDAGIYWVDKQISRLVAALRHLNRWDDTVLAVTADHGEEFLENDARYHSPTSLTDRLIRVPLLIRVAGTRGFPQPDVPFSLIHLAPTLLDILQVEAPDGFTGRSCWSEISNGGLRDEPVVVECVGACHNPLRMEHRLLPRLLAVRDSSYKLVINFRENTDLLFNLENDPDEMRPLPSKACMKERVRLLKVAYQHLQVSHHERNESLRIRGRARDFLQLMKPAGKQRDAMEPALVSKM